MGRPGRRVWLLIIPIVGAASSGGLAVLTSDVAAAVSPGACGSVLLAGGSWLNGGGVDVKSNGPRQGTGKGCGGTSTVKGIAAGTKYQCTELINRLYITKGWISGTWHGNGGRSSESARDSLFDKAPSGLTREANGSITSVSPGDVISINEYKDREFLEDGHAMIVNSNSKVVTGAVPLVGQNGGDTSSATWTRTANLKNGTLTFPSSGHYTYKAIGVVHAPASPWLGTWVGTVRDDRNAGPYRVSMHITSVRTHKVGTTEYSGNVRCGGVNTLISVSAQSLRVHEHITHGPTVCAEDGNVALKRTSNRCIASWAWTGPDETRVTATVKRSGCS